MCVVTNLDLQDKKLVFFRESQKFLLYTGYNGKKYKAKRFL